MSAGDALLAFLGGRNEVEGWLLVRGGVVATQGPALEGMPDLADPETGDPVRLVAVVPGDAISLHWLELPPGLAPAQAVAAARLMAADVSAQPVADMHVAVGPEVEGETARIVALVPAITMAGWLGRLQTHGLDPDVVIPEPLLLPRPEEGFVRYDGGPLPLFRGPQDAFSLEAELAELVLQGSSVVTLGDPEFHSALGEAIANPPVNLRQGVFAKRRRWTLDWKLIRRLAMLALGILLITLAIQVVNILRYTYAADAMEAEAGRVAARAVPNAGASSGPADLARRLTELGGGGADYGSMAAAVFAGIRDTPNVQLAAMTFDRGGTLRATVEADAPASVSAFQARLAASGFTVEAGPMRSAGGRPTAELTVRAR